MSFSIRQFTDRDVTAALQLCRSAGWNQLDSDWSRLIRYEPHGCWVAEVDERLVGTVTTTRYGRDLAWIGMMLVDPNFRRRGIAMALLRTSIEHLQSQGIPCIKLDATPEGKLVYEQLGFQTEWTYRRWQCELAPIRDDSEQLTPPDRSPSPSLLSAAASLDVHAFGVDRVDWIRRLIRDSSTCFRADGWGMIRPGHLAHYLGPLIAANAQTAAKIVDDLLTGVAGKIFWDVPQTNPQAVRLAEQRGFVAVRDLERMWLGQPLSRPPRVDLQYAICDPGTG